MADNTRGNWKNWFEFMFSCIGCVVGLGNIWRFPYVCFKNGGGAFMIPYLIFMLLAALPLVFVELSYSQYSNLGPGKVWICCPLFKGVGYGMITLTGIVSLYYTVILAWTLFYFGHSFFSTIPWSHCGSEWNTEYCYLRGKGLNGSADNNSTMNIGTNVTELLRKTATEEFWENQALQISKGIEYPGNVSWQLLLCLFAAWLLVFLCLLKGIKTSGKVMYVAATVPYIFLTILLIRGLTLPGAIDGLRYYVIPRWNDLTKFSVWVDAAVQMAYSAGLGWGGLSTLASYNNFNNNCYRDAMILPVIDIVTSWFAGCVIFVTLGFMAQEAKMEITEVVKDGPGIAFMVYPEALSKLPLPQLWSVLFFLMLFTVGLDSQMVHIQTLTGALMDNFPRHLNKRKTLVTGVVCFVGFLFGIPCITQGGIYVLTLVDWYCASLSVMLIAAMEVTILAWVYGADRLTKDIEMMIGYKPPRIWKILWKFVTPCVMFFVWIVGIVQHKPVVYGTYQYPDSSIALGWLIGLTSLVPVPLGIIHTLYYMEGSLVERLRQSIKPSPKWKPAIPGSFEEHAFALDKSTKIQNGRESPIHIALK